MIRYHARWVLPITAPPVEHGTVVEAQGRIVYVGPRAVAPAGEDVELGDALLMPGLVNAHCHLELTAMRGFLEDLDFRRWILTLTTAKRAVLTRDTLLDAARLGLAEGVRAGITTYADTCDSGVALEAMLEAGVRGIMYQEVFGPDPQQCEGSMAALRDKVEALRAHETALVRVGISPHAPYTVSDELFAAAAAYARRDALPIAVHIAESAVEHELVCDAAGLFADGLRGRGIAVAVRGRSPVAVLERTGVLAARPLLIHCVRTDAADVRLMVERRCSVAHCPASNAKLGHGIAPLMEWLAAGLPVGLGSDSVASNNRMDILEEARLAALFQRASRGVPDALPAAAALELATLGGARALGLEAEIGSLTPGKAADLAAFPLESPRGAHVPDPAAAAVFALAGAQADFVAVAGRPLVRDGRPLFHDPALVGRVQSTCDALALWRAGREATGSSEPPLADHR